MKTAGFAWFSRRQWARLREISQDSAFLHESYDEWLALASERFDEMRRMGILVERVDIDTEELVRWCNAKGLAVTKIGRSKFVDEKLRRRMVKEAPSPPLRNRKTKTRPRPTRDV